MDRLSSLSAFLLRCGALIAFALLVFPSPGFAANNHASMAEATQHAMSEAPASSWCSYAYGAIGATTAYTRAKYYGTTPPSVSYEHACKRPDGSEFSYTDGPRHGWVSSERCDAPKVLLSDGTCDDPNARCLALNSEFSAMGPQPRTWTSRCLANGCQMVMDNPVTTQVQGLGAVHRGTLRITGACAAAPTTPVDDPEDDKKDKECTPAPGGQTFCVKANGEKCYSAGAGRQVCWSDGQTGTKTDGNVAQKRTPGTDPQTPPTPPEGTTLTPGTPTTTTQTSTGGPTIVTTVINYTTNTGTDAGDSNDGENVNGDDGGEEDGTGVTGGQDCSTPPACMDNREAVGCAILLQSWKNRCALEGNGFDPTGEAAAIDSTLPAAGNSGVPGLGIENESGSIYNGIVNGSHGWAPRPACPINIGVNIRWGFITADNSQLCQVMDALAALVLLAGYVAAGFILMGANKGI